MTPISGTREPPSDASTPTRARIVATIGPASESPDMVARLIEAGVSIFRFNFSHGAFEEHARRLTTVREQASRLSRTVACLGDLPGPKIRVGRVPEGGFALEPGQDICFRRDLDVARIEKRDGRTCYVLPTTYPELIVEVLPGQRVLLADGSIRTLAVEATGEELVCRVTCGGPLTSSKGINLPESDISAPAITDRDWRAVTWAVEHGIDFLALSFVRSPDEVRLLKDRLWGMCSVDRAETDAGAGSMIPVIAKIEKPQAVARIDEIVEAADAIMVARGDLGVEMDLARVPVAQQRILAACRAHGKPAIVATQMLETMIENASPTRAEVSDVANAIFAGASAVMLSGETAVGRHPALVVETMRRVIAASEERISETPAAYTGPTRVAAGHEVPVTLARAAFNAVADLPSPVVVCWSENGGTARYLSQTGVACPIVAWSGSDRATRRMSLLPGVVPIRQAAPPSGTMRDWLHVVDDTLLALRLARPGDWIVVLAGAPLGESKRTNSLIVRRLGDGGAPMRP